MLYHLNLKHRETGSEENKFGSHEELTELAKINADRFHAILGPAHFDQVQDKLGHLETLRRSVEFDYSVAPWDSGGRYRLELANLDREIGKLRDWLRGESAHERKKVS